MNERIKELIEQAGIESYPAKLLVNTDEEGKVSSKWEIPLEKFAELIVRECIELCAKEHAHSIHTLAGPWNSAIKRCKENIATQFGVGRTFRS